MEKERIGCVSVDSGMLKICDPCYDREDNFLDFEKVYEHVNNKQFNKDGFKQIHHPKGYTGRAVIIGNFGGDGLYSVYAIKDENGTIKSITIDFDEYDKLAEGLHLV